MQSCCLPTRPRSAAGSGNFGLALRRFRLQNQLLCHRPASKVSPHARAAARCSRAAVGVQFLDFFLSVARAMNPWEIGHIREQSSFVVGTLICAASMTELIIGAFTKPDGLYPRAGMLFCLTASAGSLARATYPGLRMEKSSFVGLCRPNVACRGAKCCFWNRKKRWILNEPGNPPCIRSMHGSPRIYLDRCTCKLCAAKSGARPVER